MRTFRTQDDEFVSQCLDHAGRIRAIERAEKQRRWCLGAAFVLALLIATVRIVAGAWDPMTFLGMLVFLGLAFLVRQETSEIRLLKLAGALRSETAPRGAA